MYLDHTALGAILFLHTTISLNNSGKCLNLGRYMFLYFNIMSCATQECSTVFVQKSIEVFAQYLHKAVPAVESFDQLCFLHL